MTAEHLGRRLLAEVEEVSLDEVLDHLMVPENDQIPSYFGFPPIDDVLEVILANSPTTKATATIPIIELIAHLPHSGTSELLYHLIAVAVLPAKLGGRHTAAIILDTQSMFSVARLVQQMNRVTEEKFQTSPSDLSNISMEDHVFAALKHVHIFHPQSLASTVTTMESLSEYLFNPRKHHSFDRAVGFVALDSVSSFHWQSRTEMHNSSNTASAMTLEPSTSSYGYAELTASIKRVQRTLHAPVLLTSWHFGPLKGSSAFAPGARLTRPSLPQPMQGLPTVRFMLRIAAVRRLPVELTLVEAQKVCQQRQEVVDQGRIECFVDEWGVDAKAVQRLHACGISEFYFSVTTTTAV